MNQKLCVGVVGLGYFSQFHLKAWCADERVHRVGVTDVDPARVAWATDNYDVEGLTDPAALIANQTLDIVDIVAPPLAHFELIKQLAATGRILICQKPFCTSISEAQAAITFAHQAGATLIIHENFRFQPWYRKVKEVLERGTLGQIYQCRFALRPGDGQGEDAYLSRQPSFRSMPKLLIHETGVHFIDLFRWLFGDVSDVYADIRQLNPAIQGEDAGVLLLNHTNGVQSSFDGNRLADHKTNNPRRTMGELTIEGQNGTLFMGGDGRIFIREHAHVDSVEVPISDPIDETTFGGGCVAALIKHVVNAATDKGVFENLAADYLPVMRACDAAYASAAKGCKIQLTE